MFVFGERGKPEYPGKNLPEQIRELTNWVHMTPSHCFNKINKADLSRVSTLKSFTIYPNPKTLFIVEVHLALKLLHRHSTSETNLTG